MSEVCCGICTECQRKCGHISSDSDLESRLAEREAELKRIKNRAQLIEDADPMDRSQEAAHYNWLDDENNRLKERLADQANALKLGVEITVAQKKCLAWAEQMLERVKPLVVEKASDSRQHFYDSTAEHWEQWLADLQKGPGRP